MNEKILALLADRGCALSVSDIAKALDARAPHVATALRRMQKLGSVALDDSLEPWLWSAVAAPSVELVQSAIAARPVLQATWPPRPMVEADDRGACWL